MSSVGRTARILRAGASLFRRGHQQTFIRRAGGGEPHIVAQYRQPPQITKNQCFQAELLSGAMWFWILWHTWHDSDAILGHFPWPDASGWTDEELGIPPDDEYGVEYNSNLDSAQSPIRLSLSGSESLYCTVTSDI